jgi:hypothetical protein
VPAPAGRTTAYTHGTPWSCPAHTTEATMIYAKPLLIIALFYGVWIALIIMCGR